jgi:hypothetical protein
VVFNTGTPLLPGETTTEGNKLFIYDTVTHHLSFIASGVPETGGTGGRFVLISEDGAAVYYEANGRVYHYETQTGATSLVATIGEPTYANEPSYTTPNGQFLVFAASGHEVGGLEEREGVKGEPRGAGVPGHPHNELYRYDAADGSVMCVSCGEGMAPVQGTMIEFNEELGGLDQTPPFVQMSENGQKVFFETTAQLVPQDTNTPKGSGAEGFPGMDVYEWEADGAEEGEGTGVFCRAVNGCTHLISTGEDVGKATFLGASEDGSNIFFATAGQLVPQATPEFPNIYDARVDGGFAPPEKETECLSCQGVGSIAPLFSPGASGTFTGAGNAPLFSAIPAATPSTTTKGVAYCSKEKSRKRNVSRCAKVVRHERKRKRHRAKKGSVRS